MTTAQTEIKLKRLEEVIEPFLNIDLSAPKVDHAWISKALQRNLRDALEGKKRG